MDYAEQFFYKQFVILDNNYGLIYKKQTHKIKKVIYQDLNKVIQQENLIFVEYNKGSINDQFKKLNIFKYLNILQPFKYFEARNQQWVVYPDILESRMTKEKLEELRKKNKLDKFLLQLILTFNELERRNLKWPLQYIEQIYYHHEVLYLGLFDYDFTIYINTTTNHDILANFLYEYFYFYEQLCQVIEFGINKLEEFILKKNNLHVINWLNPPYERVLQFILEIRDEQLNTLSSNPNSVIKKFDTPKVLKQVLSNTVGQHLMYKSICFNNLQQDDQTILQTSREIENFEKCSSLFYVAECYFYFRIQQYCFLVQKLYLGSARNLIDQWQVQELNKIQIRKQVYFFAQRFAQALKEFHNNRILHRDLKPENILVEEFDFELGDFYIVDLDRSKYLQTLSVVNATSNMINNTKLYNPPETPTQIQDFSYDIFQYGLIVLEVANKGKYVGNQNIGPRYIELEEFNSYYSLEAIRNRLMEIADFHEEFMILIANCLELNSKDRPDASEVYQIITRLHTKGKITVVQSNQLQQQL